MIQTEEVGEEEKEEQKEEGGQEEEKTAGVVVEARVDLESRSGKSSGE